MLSPGGDPLKSKIFIQVTLEMVRWTQVKKFLSGNKVIRSSMDYLTILDSVSDAIGMYTKQVIIGGCSQYIEWHTALSHKECEGQLAFAILFLFYHGF